MMYVGNARKRRWPRRLFVALLFVVLLLVAATAAVRYVYNQNLQPVSSSEKVVLVTIEPGATVEQIALILKEKGLVKSAWAFRMYISSKEARSDLKAGEYELQPSLGVAEIVSVISRGKIATNLVTIIPGRRIDQVKQRLLEEGFSEAEATAALDPASYAGNPALVDKPTAASLEGYIYPDSYQKTSTTSAKAVISQSLMEMEEALSPELRSAFAAQGLSTYQAITLASIVEREVASQSDRDQAAQVFLKRWRNGIALQSDATRFYFNSYTTAGLPSTPISNVTKSSLQAVAHPASTDWLYFVSGDDGITRFSSTLAAHQANIDQYCQKSCTKR
jgi:UPF0755 protein